MPKNHLRRLLVALLVALVPLQGLAALSVGICRDLERSQESAQRSMSVNFAHAHTHDAQLSAANGAEHGSKAANDHHTAHCSACAACGVSAGIVSLAPMPIAEAPRNGAIGHIGTQFSGFVPEAPDRPPLKPLA